MTAFCPVCGQVHSISDSGFCGIAGVYIEQDIIMDCPDYNNKEEEEKEEDWDENY